MTTVYLDYNATTVMPKPIIDVLIKWCTRGNCSSIYPSAKAGKALIRDFKQEIATVCKFPLEGPNSYSIVFTSGGSESNTWIITSIIRAFVKATGKKAHIIVSNVEHDNILILADNLEAEDVDVTRIPITTSGPLLGTVDPEDVYKAIRPNTCVIAIMAANNETGIRNDIKAIGHIAKNRAVPIPFFTDAVQIFGKESIDPLANDITAFSGSFHKLHGPTGTGVAVIRNDLIEGYNLKALIPGHQNNEMRGGTECIHNIAAARAAYKMSFENRDEKNMLQLNLKKYLIKKIGSYFPIIELETYKINKEYNKPMPEKYIVWITNSDMNKVLHNTIFISVIYPKVCNIEIRKELASRLIYVSIGSACKIGQKTASHVLLAMGVPDELKPGVLRISLGDFTTKDEIDAFIATIYYIINNNLCVMK